MSDEHKNTGLAPERTARLIASLIALTGMVFLFLERILSAVLVMASDGVKLGLARYNNFTGQFAAQNFAEDKKLLGLLKEVQSILPTAESALTIFMIVAIVLLVIAAIGFALPRQTVHVLVALKLLKWQSGEVVEGAGASFREVIEKVGNIPLKKLAIPCAVILAIVIGTVIVRSCHEGVLQASVDSALEDLKQNTSAYIDAQKAYFGKNKVIGGPKALQLPRLQDYRDKVRRHIQGPARELPCRNQVERILQHQGPVRQGTHALPQAPARHGLRQAVA